MKTSLLEKYNKLIKTKELLSDQAQLKVLNELDRFRIFIEENHNRFFKKKYQYQGIYIFGDVGRGKSFLMQLFFDEINIPKQRIHFHEFMNNIHQELHILRSAKNPTENPLKKIIKKLSKDISLICFDEFHISDIADAMILETIFTELIHNNIYLIITSNRSPEDLYKGGLQREKYLKFVNFIKDHLLISEIESNNDYRALSTISKHQTYFYPLNQDNTDKIYDIFKKISKNIISGHLKNLGRNITIEKSSENCAILDFNEFCTKPYSTSDYNLIASTYKTIIITNINEIKDRNEAKRFMNLIDILYERKNYVIFLAEKEPEKIYQQRQGAFEFDRTISRIKEMLSDKYILDNS